jgi:hypothetical protein
MLTPLGNRPAPASAAACLALFVLAGSAVAAGPKAVQRPVSDFLAAQGTTQVQTAPVPDYLAWTDAGTGVMIAMDYAGIADAWRVGAGGGSYGTAITGTVTERTRADGRADVRIVLHVRNALTYVVGYDATTGPDYTDVRFGSLAPAALDSGDAALGDCEFQVRIVNTAPGAPLPDLFDAFVLGNGAPGVELVFLSFSGQATGTLHEGAIVGVPEGTPGRAATHQTGVFMSGFHGAAGDGFPAESVTLSVQ